MSEIEGIWQELHGLRRRVAELETLEYPTPSQRSIEVPGTGITRYGVIEAVFRKSLTRATVTPVFTITTTDETGDVDAGSYQVKIEGVVHAAAGNASNPSSSRGFSCAFTRTMAAAGIGSNSAVKTVYDTDAASTDAGVREVAVPTVQVVETSEYVQVVAINCDVTGSGPVNPVVTLFVRVAWGSFITAPVLAVV